MNVVIYARFSSHNQREESIEGQLKVCYEFAKRNNYIVIGEYIDRAFTATNDKRPDFRRMIEDSYNKKFQGVLVYQLDRFARNRYDSAMYKKILVGNGVKVISACEHITDDASGRLVEGVLESMAEYYSLELAQKIRRGMSVNASKCLCTGGNVALGYKVKNKHLVINEKTAPIVKKIFEMYADGKTVTEIISYLNERNIKTSRGGVFNKNSLHRILKNKRYIGIYTFKGSEKENGIPRIIDDELFYKVAQIMEKNKKAPARARAKEEYLLTTKLFCGNCKEMMIGICGTSKTGQKHHYYVCKGKKPKNCKKKSVKKNYIEDIVIEKCRTLLTAKNIAKISKKVVKFCNDENKNSNVSYLQKQLKEAETQTNNLIDSLKICELNSAKQAIFEEIEKMENAKTNLRKELAIEEKFIVKLTVDEVEFFLNSLKNGKIDDIKYRKALINIFVNSIYLYDNEILIIFNSGSTPIKVNINLLADIEKSTKSFYEAPDNNVGNSNAVNKSEESSFKGMSPPPKLITKKYTRK